MSRLSKLRNFFRKREQRSEELAQATVKLSLGAGYSGEYFVESDEAKTPNEANSGFKFGKTAVDLKDNEGTYEATGSTFSSVATFLMLDLYIQPLTFAGKVDTKSISNRLSVGFQGVLKQEFVNGKYQTRKDSQTLSESKDKMGFASLRYAVNFMVGGVLLPQFDLVGYIGINLLSAAGYGNSRMTTFGSTFVASVSGYLLSLSFIKLGLGLAFLDGSILAKVVIGLKKSKSFLVV